MRRPVEVAVVLKLARRRHVAVVPESLEVVDGRGGGPVGALLVGVAARGRVGGREDVDVGAAPLGQPAHVHWQPHRRLLLVQRPPLGGGAGEAHLDELGEGVLARDDADEALHLVDDGQVAHAQEVEDVVHARQRHAEGHDQG